MAHYLDRIGQQIGDYHLQRWLGGGGFGNVYLAEHVRDHSQVAIKLLHNRLSHNESLKVFINEARTVRLKHVHIVPLLDFGISREEIPFLVMEYAAQGTLRDRYPQGSQVPLPLVADYAQQVGSALQYAHDEKLIHRDIKPENILLDQHDNVLLGDFGIALVAQSSRSQSAQEVVGTAAYSRILGWLPSRTAYRPWLLTRGRGVARLPIWHQSRYRGRQKARAINTASG